MLDAKSLNSLEKEITDTFTSYPFLERLAKKNKASATQAQLTHI